MFLYSIHNAIKSLNSSTFFGGLMMLMLNIVSKYVTVEFSKTQQQYLRSTVSRQVMVFIIAFMGTKDIYTSLALTAFFVILADYLFNDQSKFCIIRNKLKAGVDTNSDGVISDEEVDKAVTILNKAKAQRDIKLRKEAFTGTY
tara:strand:+ start:181 stop:609 length:429 start_codon:yes stop_codon:yes gene_type:complete